MAVFSRMFIRSSNPSISFNLLRSIITSPKKPLTEVTGACCLVIKFKSFVRSLIFFGILFLSALVSNTCLIILF